MALASHSSFPIAIRKKLKHSLIEDDADRRNSFMKRKKTLLKKALEVSNICDVDVCLIVCSPFDQKAEIWPPSPEQAQKVIERFQQLPEMERKRKMLTPEKMAKEKMTKLHEQVQRIRMYNRKMEVRRFISGCLAGEWGENLNAIDLIDIERFTTYKMREISEKMEQMKKHDSPPPAVSPPESLPVTEKMKNPSSEDSVEQPGCGGDGEVGDGAGPSPSTA